MTIEEGRVSANGIDFHYLSAGDGPLALLLHGFPDTAWTWRLLMPALTEAGYRAVAPFMRGYFPTGLAPDDVYQTGALAADACALHEVLGGGPDAVVIGHDWGAIAAYGAAGHQPERWAKVVGAAVPPGDAVGRAFLDYSQLRRSWYMFFFQHPLSDLIVPLDDLSFIGRLWSDWSPGYDASEDLARVRDSLRDPAHLAAALGYYRATLGSGPTSPEYEAPQAAARQLPNQPLLYLQGLDDGCIGAEVSADLPSSLGEGSRMAVVDGAGHFLHLERPDVVNALILDFLAE